MKNTLALEKSQTNQNFEAKGKSITSKELPILTSVFMKNGYIFLKNHPTNLNPKTTISTLTNEN